MERIRSEGINLSPMFLKESPEIEECKYCRGEERLAAVCIKNLRMAMNLIVLGKKTLMCGEKMANFQART